MKALERDHAQYADTIVLLSESFTNAIVSTSMPGA
jgi:hypothetical protein